MAISKAMCRLCYGTLSYYEWSGGGGETTLVVAFAIVLWYELIDKLSVGIYKYRMVAILRWKLLTNSIIYRGYVVWTHREVCQFYRCANLYYARFPTLFESYALDLYVAPRNLWECYASQCHANRVAKLFWK